MAWFPCLCRRRAVFCLRHRLGPSIQLILPLACGHRRGRFFRLLTSRAFLEYIFSYPDLDLSCVHSRSVPHFHGTALRATFCWRIYSRRLLCCICMLTHATNFDHPPFRSLVRVACSWLCSHSLRIVEAAVRVWNNFLEFTVWYFFFFFFKMLDYDSLQFFCYALCVWERQKGYVDGAEKNNAQRLPPADPKHALSISRALLQYPGILLLKSHNGLCSYL